MTWRSLSSLSLSLSLSLSCRHQHDCHDSCRLTSTSPTKALKFPKGVQHKSGGGNSGNTLREALLTGHISSDLQFCGTNLLTRFLLNARPPRSPADWPPELVVNIPSSQGGREPGFSQSKQIHAQNPDQLGNSVPNWGTFRCLRGP